MNHPCACQTTLPSTPPPAELAAILERFPSQKREYLIPILQVTQEKFKFLSRDAMIHIAQHVGVPVSKVYGVATFYNQFKLNPPGKHTIQVCRGTACHVRGSDQLLRSFESELGVAPGQTTKDGLFTLDIVACLGSCSIAPVVTVDGTFHGRLENKDAGKLVAEIRKGEGQ
ncbi:MAG: NAD(P)H-dependent oxidoreductase subunit E [Candidatus Riflebacteria bacterium]|nr:NAD(P)H-dependent oxidoreductase subunit E [Candidatus Riflebacteria bacterium]